MGGRVAYRNGSSLTRALLAVAMVVPATLLVAGAIAAPVGATVRRDSQPGGPILECSFKDTKTGKWNSLWGYENDTSQSYTVPVGSYNQFNNPSANAGQPTTFQKGRHDNVFTVTYTGTSSWTLGTVTVTGPGTKTCATNPVPFLPSGVPAWVTIGALMVVVVAGGFVVQRRLERARREP